MSTLTGRAAAFVRRRLGRPGRQVKSISASGLFDPAWYQRQSGEQGSNPQALLLHYLREGAARGLDPHPLFDTDWYLRNNPDVGAAALNPLLHFVEGGGLEGRDPHPLFDSDWYLNLNPAVREHRLNPLVHYLGIGAAAGRDPHPLFDTAWYLQINPAVKEQGLNPLLHYLQVGAAAGSDPHPLFKSRWYLAQYPDVRDARANPLHHYLTEGAARGYDPNPLFDSDWYLQVNPDVAAAGINPLIDYVLEGAAAGRAPSPLLSTRSILAQAGSPARTDFGWTRRDGPAARERAGAAVEIFAPPRQGSADALQRAIAAAAAAHRHLLIAPAGIAVTPEQAAALARRFDADPMIGSVAPRLAPSPDTVLPLPGADNDLLERAILALGPETALAPDYLSPCLLMRDVLVANLPSSIAGLSTWPGVLRALLAWGRRLGYRTLIDNRVVVALERREAASLPIDAEERAQLARLFPDVATADARLAQLPLVYREALLARARRDAQGRRPSLLVDCSGLAVGHSGSSEAMIGILDGLKESARGFAITVFGSRDALAFHDLARRYPDFRCHDRLSGAFSVALRLSQPWEIGDLVGLHRHARKIAVLVLDTIGWDILYSLERDVGPLWRLLAAEADGIAHISSFTRDRFNYRFPVAPHVTQTVAYLSCHYAEYGVATAPARPAGGHVLLLGNSLAHKGLTAAIAVLAEAFPDQQFVVIGQSDYRDRNVTSVASGQISGAIVEQLYRGARMMIFPSFYEGFGFPIIRGLAYGMDVVARRSALLSEIAAQCAPRGRILPFDDPSSLVAVVRAALASEPVETVPLGGAIAPGGEAARWRDTAARLMDLVEGLATDTTLERHDRRERVMRLMPDGGS